MTLPRYSRHQTEFLILLFATLLVAESRPALSKGEVAKLGEIAHLKGRIECIESDAIHPYPFLLASKKAGEFSGTLLGSCCLLLSHGFQIETGDLVGVCALHSPRRYEEFLPLVIVDHSKNGDTLTLWELSSSIPYSVPAREELIRCIGALDPEICQPEVVFLEGNVTAINMTAGRERPHLILDDQYRLVVDPDSLGALEKFEICMGDFLSVISKVVSKTEKDYLALRIRKEDGSTVELQDREGLPTEEPQDSGRKPGPSHPFP